MYYTLIFQSDLNHYHLTVLLLLLQSWLKKIYHGIVAVFVLTDFPAQMGVTMPRTAYPRTVSASLLANSLLFL